MDWSLGLESWSGVLEWILEVEPWNAANVLALCILCSGVMDWSLGVESWSGVLEWIIRVEHWNETLSVLLNLKFDQNLYLSASIMICPDLVS